SAQGKRVKQLMDLVPRSLAGLAVLSGLLFCTALPSSGDNSLDTEERFQQALRLRRQVNSFKLNARQFHLDTGKEEGKTQKLRSEAIRLHSSLQTQPLSAGVNQDYHKLLASYLNHAKEYQAHLASY